MRNMSWSQDPEEIPEVLIVIRFHDAMSTFLSNLAAFLAVGQKCFKRKSLLGRYGQGLRDKGFRQKLCDRFYIQLEIGGRRRACSLKPMNELSRGACSVRLVSVVFCCFTWIQPNHLRLKISFISISAVFN